MPKGTDDDVVGKRKKVQLTTAWLKEAWPLRDAPSVQAMLMADFKTLKKAKTGRSQGVLMDALEDVDKGLRALQAEANRIPRTHPLKKKAITKDLEYARSLVAKELGILAKVGNAMRVVYKKDFGVAMAANLTTQKIEVANRPVTLSLLEALAIELARSVASLAKEIVTVLMDLDNEPWPVYFCFTMTCRDFIVPKQRDSGLFI